MRTSAALLVGLAVVDTCYAAENAPVVTNNPLHVIYTAALPPEPFFKAPELSDNIRGFISASAPPDGVGVRFIVRFENLPKTGGPFPYHLHVKKAAGGNCTATGPHLDPMNRGDKPPCDAANQPSCQVGDMSGKYGKIDSDPFTAEFVDKFSSLREDDPAFFGNGSFVIHLANSTRITCADFVKGGAAASGLPSASPTGINGTSGNDGSCSLANDGKAACLPRASGGCPGLSTTSAAKSTAPSATVMIPSASGPSPPIVTAAAGKMTPWLLAFWAWPAALVLGMV